jgi:glutaconate CoA-transferase subunit B
VDYGFLGAAMIDQYANINTTVIGEHATPRVRLPGSGGANDVGSFCWRTIIMMRQEKRRFLKKVDFITTPGYLTGPGAREKAGLPLGSGPYRVITQLGVYGFDEATKRLKLLAMHPGVTVEQIQENSEFEILIADHVETTQPPTGEERRLLREIDPTGMAIGK